MKEKAKRLGTILFPVILFLYPLLKITQGIELTDTCYGLVNYRFFPHAGQEWTVATYLANVLGALLMRLPFGDSLVGMRFYTGLFVSAMALLAYFFISHFAIATNRNKSKGIHCFSPFHRKKLWSHTNSKLFNKYTTFFCNYKVTPFVKYYNNTKYQKC